MNNLEINLEKREEEIILKCSGRLDANSAGHLNDQINRLVREGQYYLTLDLLDIEYLSSAGIRSLVSQYKNLKAINGRFYISSMSKNVSQVLEMVGMLTMLTQHEQKKEVSKKETEYSGQQVAFNFTFTPLILNKEASTEIQFFGKPELIQQSGYTATNARQSISALNHFAIGLGAIGDSFSECKNRFGEFLMLGKNVAYLPADGSKKPDYMVSSGQLVASLTELYGLHFEGNFSLVIRFEATSDQSTIGFSQLMEGIKKMIPAHNWAFVMLAESGGLIGTSLNGSPVDGRRLFTFPEIKETINFTTEPAHNKMLTLSVGIIASEKEKEFYKFTRPLASGNELRGHVHSAIFPYTPLKKKDIDLYETIDYLFDNSELIDLLHLTNDTREIIGLGESQFVQGFCWIAPISSSINTSK